MKCIEKLSFTSWITIFLKNIIVRCKNEIRKYTEELKEMISNGPEYQLLNKIHQDDIKEHCKNARDKSSRIIRRIDRYKLPGTGSVYVLLDLKQIL